MLPDVLHSTRDLLLRTYRGPVPAARVLACMRALYDDLSDRNLAAVMADVNGDGAWLNEVYRCAQLSLADPAVQREVAALTAHGLDAWRAEP